MERVSAFPPLLLLIQLKEMLKKTKSSNNNSNILILEDDLDQMDLLSHFALSEINRLIDDENTYDEQRQKIKKTRIIKVNSIDSLKKAVTLHKRVLLAVLDCNTPDAKGGVSHDQLVKTSRGITGQHKAVDIVTEHLPGTPITIISSMDRFQRIVNKHYASKHNLSINFIRKNDPMGIRENIRYYLREYLESVD